MGAEGHDRINVLNNPVNAIDPEGLFVGPAVAIGVGAGVALIWIEIAYPGAIDSFVKDLLSPESAIPHPGKSPLSKTYENYLLDTYKPPGYPQTPEEWCPELKKVIDEIASQIAWRKLDIKYNDYRIGRSENRISRERHNRRIRRLNELLKKLEKRYNDFCKPEC